MSPGNTNISETAASPPMKARMSRTLVTTKAMKMARLRRSTVAVAYSQFAVFATVNLSGTPIGPRVPRWEEGGQNGSRITSNEVNFQE